MNFNGTNNSYIADRYTTILWLEESGKECLTPYNDGKNNVTIGAGYNLADATVRPFVFAALGITDAALIKDLTKYLSTKQAKNDDDIQSDLGDVMSDHGKLGSFEFSNRGQVLGVFNGTNGYDGLAQVYENRVDRWAAKGGLVIPQSKERLVLLSLAYNGGLAGGLRKAIAEGDRAKAWYEIRYRTNGGQDGGIAKRRYRNPWGQRRIDWEPLGSETH